MNLKQKIEDRLESLSRYDQEVKRAREDLKEDDQYFKGFYAGMAIAMGFERGVLKELLRLEELERYE